MSEAQHMDKKLPSLYNLSDRHPGVTKSIGDSYAEAASVCLNRHHASPINFDIFCNLEKLRGSIDWTKPDDRTKRAWANDIDTTESGAYGISLVAVEEEKGLVAIARAETLTGADYYIAHPNSPIDDLENLIRLEVSGIDHGNETEIKRRLLIKKRQTLAGNSNKPAIAAVVGFKELKIFISDVDSEK